MYMHIQPGAVKYWFSDLARMNVTQVHSVMSENQCHCTRLYTGIWYDAYMYVIWMWFVIIILRQGWSQII